MQTVYVMAKSKRSVNGALLVGVKMHALEFTPHSANVLDLADMPDGTVVKIFEKYVGGSPYAKAYGNVKRDKAGNVRIK